MTTDPQRYRRRPRRVFRVLHGQGWVAGPDRSTVTIGGSALYVFVVLDGEATVAELLDEIRREWPEFTGVHESEVREAIDALVAHDLVEVAGPSGAPPDPAGAP